MVHSAGIQDRDGGISLLATMKGLFPFLEKLFADSAYQGPLLAKALAKILPRLETEIVKRSDHARGFIDGCTSNSRSFGSRCPSLGACSSS